MEVKRFILLNFFRNSLRRPDEGLYSLFVIVIYSFLRLPAASSALSSARLARYPSGTPSLCPPPHYQRAASGGCKDGRRRVKLWARATMALLFLLFLLVSTRPRFKISRLLLPSSRTRSRVGSSLWRTSASGRWRSPGSL